MILPILSILSGILSEESSRPQKQREPRGQPGLSCNKQFNKAYAISTIIGHSPPNVQLKGPYLLALSVLRVGEPLVSSCV